MSVPSDRPSAISTVARPDDPGRQGRSLLDRMRLGLILLILPALVVCAPIVVTVYFFGQRPKPNAPPHTEGLQRTLQQSASSLLPDPSAIGPDALVVTVRADHLGARMERIMAAAQVLGGSASEGLSTATEKRLSVDLPAGQLEVFRAAVKTNAAPAAVAPAAGTASAGHDYVDVVIRGTAADE